jgi:transposase
MSSRVPSSVSGPCIRPAGYLSDARYGSFATRPCQQQVRSCPLCAESGSKFRALLWVDGAARDVIQAPKLEPWIVRDELSDFEWAAIKPLLPNKSRGVRRVNDRRVLNGIFWVLRSGAPWRDLPVCYGPRTTCYNRFVRWRRGAAAEITSWATSTAAFVMRHSYVRFVAARADVRRGEWSDRCRPCALSDQQSGSIERRAAGEARRARASPDRTSLQAAARSWRHHPRRGDQRSPSAPLT